MPTGYDDHMRLEVLALLLSKVVPELGVTRKRFPPGSPLPPDSLALRVLDGFAPMPDFVMLVAPDGVGFAGVLLGISSVSGDLLTLNDLTERASSDGEAPYWVLAALDEVLRTVVPDGIVRAAGVADAAALDGFFRDAYLEAAAKAERMRALLASLGPRRSDP